MLSPIVKITAILFVAASGTLATAATQNDTPKHGRHLGSSTRELTQADFESGESGVCQGNIYDQNVKLVEDISCPNGITDTTGFLQDSDDFRPTLITLEPGHSFDGNHHKIELPPYNGTKENHVALGAGGTAFDGIFVGGYYGVFLRPYFSCGVVCDHIKTNLDPWLSFRTSTVKDCTFDGVRYASDHTNPPEPTTNDTSAFGMAINVEWDNLDISGAWFALYFRDADSGATAKIVDTTVDSSVYGLRLNREELSQDGSSIEVIDSVFSNYSSYGLNFESGTNIVKNVEIVQAKEGDSSNNGLLLEFNGTTVIVQDSTFCPDQTGNDIHGLAVEDAGHLILQGDVICNADEMDLEATATLTGACSMACF